MKTLTKNKTEYAIIQSGYACFGVAKTVNGVKRVAYKWTDEGAKSEIKNLSVQYSMTGGMVGDLILIPCSKKYANLVRKNGGDIGYNEIDGVVYADCELDDNGDLK